jgi:hypothetical protein
MFDLLHQQCAEQESKRAGEEQRDHAEEKRIGE